MTDPMHTHLEFVVDMSGSMSSMSFEAQQGYQALLEVQEKIEGKCSVSLNRFSSGYENVYRDRAVADAPGLQVNSRGDSALYDAISRAATDLGATLNSRPEVERPGKIVMIVLSDGVDTASLQHDLADVHRLVTRQQSIYKWFFIYLGSRHDAIKVGTGLGIPEGHCLLFKPERVKQALTATSDLIAQLRSADAAQRWGGIQFTPQQRQRVI